MALISQNIEGNNLLRITGAVVAAFSLVMGALIFFVIPSACSFLSSLGLLILGFLFIGGLAALLLGQVLVWRKKVR